MNVPSKLTTAMEMRLAPTLLEVLFVHATQVILEMEQIA